MAEKLYELITPDSETDSAAEEYEYMLLFVDTRGCFFMWLFTDWIEKQRVAVNNSNKANIQINSFISDIDNTVDLKAENLNADEYQQLKSVLQSNNVFRLYKDGTKEKVGIISSNTSFRKTDKQLEINITIEKNKTPTYR